MIWIAHAGMFMIGIATLSWVIGFGRLANLNGQHDDMLPIWSIRIFNIFLCGMAVVELGAGMFFIIYGLGALWNK